MNTISKSFLLFSVSAVTLLSGCKSDDPVQTVDTLPSNLITKIVIDKQGIKWIATDKGLVSFNGKQFTTYNSLPMLYGYPMKDVSLDEVSGNPQLWSATLLGIVQSNIANQSLIITNFYRKTLGGLLSDTVWAVTTDKNRSTFFGTPNGLSIFRSPVWTSYNGKWGGNKDNFLVQIPLQLLPQLKTAGIMCQPTGGAFHALNMPMP